MQNAALWPGNLQALGTPCAAICRPVLLSSRLLSPSPSAPPEQPDVSSDEEGGEDDGDGSTVSEQEDAAGGENDPDGALLTDDDLLDLFMVRSHF